MGREWEKNMQHFNKKRLCISGLSGLVLAAMLITEAGGSGTLVYGGESHRITGFAEFDESAHCLSVGYANRPSEDKVISAMPDTIEVYLEGSADAVEIPVTWAAVGEDYETTDSYYIQYSPVIEGDYTLAEGLDLTADAPYIGLFLLQNEVSASAPVTGSDGSGAGEADDSSPAEFEESAVTTYAFSASENSDNVFQYLTDTLGYNSAIACGIMASIYHESSFIPTALQMTSAPYKDGYTNETYTAAVDDGTYEEFTTDGAGYGLCQWTYASRKEALLNYAQELGVSIGDYGMQLSHMNSEIANYSKVSSYIEENASVNTSTVAYRLGYYFAYYYEAPADKEESSITRGRFAVDTLWPIYGTGEDDWDGNTDPTGAVDDGSSDENSDKGNAGDSSDTSDDKGNAGGTNDSENGDSSEVAEPETPIALYKTTASSLNVRSGPDTSYSSLGSVSKGTEVEVYEFDGKWARILYKGKTGWLSGDYLELVEQYYTVVYDANGGHGSMENTQVTYGTSTALSANSFVNEGYVFVGWIAYRASDDKYYTKSGWKTSKEIATKGYTLYTYSNKAKIAKTSAVAGDVCTFAAQWRKCTFTVQYDANGGSGSMADTKVPYSANTSLRTNTFKKSGYAFTGWYAYRTSDSKWYAVKTDGSKGWYTQKVIDANGYTKYLYKDSATVAKTSSVDEDVVIFYAQWVVPVYTVVFDANGGSGTMDSIQVTYGVKTKLPKNAYKRSGYIFDGWVAYRESDQKWYAVANDGSKGWYLQSVIDKNDYSKYLYSNQATISKTSSVNGDVVTMYARWSKVE